MLLSSLVVSKDKVWRDQFYDGHPNKERSKILYDNNCPTILSLTDYFYEVD